MGDDLRRLRADKLIETADRLASKVVGRFPEASLGKVAVAVSDVTRNAVETAERINRPNWKLRIGLISMAALILAVAGTSAYVIATRYHDHLFEIGRVASGAGLWLG